MKKTVLTMVALLTMISMAVSANGIKEDSVSNTWVPGYGRFVQDGTITPYSGDIITKTGTLKLTDNDRPKLITGNETYELMYPYYYSYNLEIKDGQEITVKGFEVPAYRWNTDGDEKHLMLTEATIDGKEYKLNNNNYYGPYGGRRGRNNRMAFNQPGGGMRNPNNMPYAGRGRW